MRILQLELLCRLPDVPEHKSYQDRSPMVVAIWQDSRTPSESRGWYIVGDRAIDVAGGIIFAFNGNELSHGLYLPDRNGRFECFSAVIVAMSA